MQFKLSEKSQAIVMLAAHLVNTRDLSCCTALDQAASVLNGPQGPALTVRELFGRFYGKHTIYNWFPEYDYEGAREARVLLLMLFLEAAQ